MRKPGRRGGAAREAPNSARPVKEEPVKVSAPRPRPGGRDPPYNLLFFVLCVLCFGMLWCVFCILWYMVVCVLYFVVCVVYCVYFREGGKGVRV